MKSFTLLISILTNAKYLMLPIIFCANVKRSIYTVLRDAQFQIFVAEMKATSKAPVFVCYNQVSGGIESRSQSLKNQIKHVQFNPLNRFYSIASMKLVI
jgi:hypothetical protein